MAINNADSRKETEYDQNMKFRHFYFVLLYMFYI